MALKKLSFILHGILNVTMHIPVLFFCMCFGGCIIGIIAELCLAFGWSYHEVSTLPGVIELMLSPLLIPPISSIIGIVRGAISIKKEMFTEFEGKLVIDVEDR